ncbi:helix-turn-helix domain-containing protein [Candidatus Palauibacter sp.]|uniref:helix-turn-helix domain-containing protein n=1 Tax=Candidatus Palauibacter sp. TaxID=3101350 RepID=UPI003CC66689
MTIRPIRNEADYDRALADIDRLMGSTPGTAAGDALEILVALVERYETEHWAIDAPDPLALIEHVMEARELRQKDLAAVIGSQPHASEVLNRRRPLSLAMIRALAAEWSLPADVLVREYELATVGAP